MKDATSINQKNLLELEKRIENKISIYFTQESSNVFKKITRPQDKELKSLKNLYERGKRDKVIKMAITLLRERLAHPYPLKLLASILKDNGEYNKWIDLLKEVVILDPMDGNSYYNLANSLKVLSEFDEAIVCYKKAISVKPQFPEAFYNLANLLAALGFIEEAKINYEKALYSKSNFFEARVGLANCLHGLGDLKGAELHYRILLKSKSENANLYYELGKILREQREFREAIKCQDRSLELDPSQTKPRIERLRCMYALDMSVQVFKELDYLISKNVVNTVVGSITHRSNLRYGTRKANLYCDEPLKFVAHTNLKAEYDFDNIFIKGVRNYLQRDSLSFRAQTLLRKGSQTSGNIFQTDDPNIRKIEKIILTEIEKYRLTYSESKDGLIRNWPDRYSLSGWIISMN